MFIEEIRRNIRQEVMSDARKLIVEIIEETIDRMLDDMGSKADAVTTPLKSFDAMMFNWCKVQPIFQG